MTEKLLKTALNPNQSICVKDVVNVLGHSESVLQSTLMQNSFFDSKIIIALLIINFRLFLMSLISPL